MDHAFSKLAPVAAPVARVLLSVMFISAGWQKIGAYAGTQAYMEALGVPGALLPLVIAVELIGGLALLVGWQARLAALLLGGFAVVSGVLFHLVPGFGLDGYEAQAQMINFMKNLTIAGGMGMVVAFGAGAFSVDSRGRAAAARPLSAG